MTSRRREEPTEEQEHNQSMKTTEIIRHTILSVTLDDIFGKFSIELDLELEQFVCTEMYLYVLSDRTRNDGKHNTTESNDRNCCPIECHILENKEYSRDQDSYLRKPSNNQRSAQFFHFPKNLKR